MARTSTKKPVKQVNKKSKGVLRVPRLSKVQLIVFGVIFAAIGGFFVYRALAVTTSVVYAGALTTDAPTNTYGLSTGSGQISIAIRARSRDLVVTVKDASGTVVATAKNSGSRTGSTSFNVTGGAYSFSVSSAATISSRKSYSLTISYPVADTTTPTAIITGPLNSDTVSGTVNFSATATDDTAVTRVEFFVGSTLLASDSSSPYQTSWDTTKTPNGAVGITVKSYDGAGNIGQATETVTINNVTPTPITTPTPTPTTSTNPIGSPPFVATSPWNTPITTAQQSKWFDVPALHTTTDGNGQPTQRNWYLGNGQLAINHGLSTDPVWTVTMPEFGNDDARFNRHWLAATFTIHAPQNVKQGTDSDHILDIIDESNGDYFEAWAGVTINATAHTITAPAGAGWARGNIRTDTGIGGILAQGGNSAGVRAANYSWLGGAITGYDIQQVLDGKKTDFGHAMALALGWDALSGNGTTSYVWPATSIDNGGASGPIKMGSRIGIPTGVTRPTQIPATDKMGIAYFNTLQKYGAFVGDFAGSAWPIFYADMGSISQTQLDAIDSTWVWWGDARFPSDPSGGSQTANRYVVPLLRVMEGQ